MIQLSDKEHNMQMDDMKSFDEQMPCVGIFWYDPEDHTFFGVRKKELTPQMVEEAAVKGKPFINYPQLNYEVWQEETKAAIEREESQTRLSFSEREQSRP
jgi:hypothetical protein